MTAEPLDLALDDDPDRIPDGSRPLLIGKPLLGLEAVEAPRDITCYMALHTRAFAAGPPPGCHVDIHVGEHILRHTQSVGPLPTGPMTHYCAPCAIREWHWWDVTETPVPA